MKQLLLVAAIYSLIIHQSQKQAKQKVLPAVKKAITKTTTSVVPRQQPITLGSFNYENAALTIGMRNIARTKLSEIE